MSHCILQSNAIMLNGFLIQFQKYFQCYCLCPRLPPLVQICPVSNISQPALPSPLVTKVRNVFFGRSLGVENTLVSTSYTSIGTFLAQWSKLYFLIFLDQLKNLKCQNIKCHLRQFAAKFSVQHPFQVFKKIQNSVLMINLDST